MKRIICLGIIFSLGAVSSVQAGGAVAARRQKETLRQRQQVMIQQQLILQQSGQQQAIQQAVNQQAQQVAQQVAVQQYMQQQAVQQVVAQRNGVRATVQVSAQQAAQEAAQQIAQQAAYEIAAQQQEADASQVKEVASFTDVVNSLDQNSQAWPLIIDNPAKEMVLAHFIQRYRDDGITIMKPPAYYATMLDGMTVESPDMLDKPLPQLLQVAAIIEYDFDNGQDKDAMARRILGQKGFEQNRQRVLTNNGM